MPAGIEPVLIRTTILGVSVPSMRPSSSDAVRTRIISVRLLKDARVAARNGLRTIQSRHKSKIKLANPINYKIFWKWALSTIMARLRTKNAFYRSLKYFIPERLNCHSMVRGIPIPTRGGGESGSFEAVGTRNRDAIVKIERSSHWAIYAK